MRTRTFWRACLFTALVLLLPGLVKAQDATGLGSPDVMYPLPLSNRPDLGGFVCSAEYVMFRQTNPLRDQIVAYRGFTDTDGSIAGSFFGLPNTPGTKFGSQREALNTHQATGPNDYSPGFKIDLGYKFDTGGELLFSWMFLTQHQTHASATSVPFGFNAGPDLADSFLFSPVYGFPNDYAGAFDVNHRKLPVGNLLAAYGIWNGASIETISFTQRTQQYEITWRDVVFETDNYRLSYLVGPRFFWFWEKFAWRTSDINIDTGEGGPLDTAIYSNIVSNRLYGAHAGFSQECYLGHGFAVQTDIEVAMLLDVVREKAEYRTGAKFGLPQPTAESKRTITTFAPVPEINGSINLVWYPIQSVQVRLGYNAMAFFNTVSSPRPIDFNYGSLTPRYESTFRLLDGLNFGVAIIW